MPAKKETRSSYQFQNKIWRNLQSISKREDWNLFQKIILTTIRKANNLTAELWGVSRKFRDWLRLLKRDWGLFYNGLIDKV